MAVAGPRGGSRIRAMLARSLSPAEAYAGGDDALAAQMRARQLHTVHVLVPFIMAGSTFAALFVCAALWRSGPRLHLAAWIAAIAVASLGWLGDWRAERGHVRPDSASRRDLHRVVLHVCIHGLLYSIGPAWFFAHVDSEGQFVLSVLSAGLISAGAFAVATVPPAGIAWVLILATGSMYSLVSSGNATYLFVAVLLANYVAVSIVTILSMTRSFFARIAAEIEGSQQRQVLGLILHDFETQASDWLWETDPAGALVRVPARLAGALGRQPGTLAGRPLVDVLAETVGAPEPEEVEALSTARRRFAGASGFRDLPVPVRIDGRLCWWALTARPLISPEGNVTGWRGVGRDVTDHRDRAAETERMANQDSLTSLANRYCFHTVLNEVVKATGAPRRCALILIDIDNFKSVNDTLGHMVGDRLLAAIAERLRAQANSGDLVARLGGDEFAMLRPDDTATPIELWRRGEEILEALREPFSLGDIRIEARASIGVAVAPDDAGRPDDLLRSAELALHAAKSRGRDTVCLFDLEMDARARHRAVVLNDLGAAIENGQFALSFQPQVDLATGRLAGFETLLHWRHPTRGELPPASFVSIAEETGLIVPIGAWILEQACLAASRWPAELRVAVNLSAVQFRSSSLIAQVADALTRTGLPPDRLELEITESSLMLDYVAARNTLQALRRMNVKIAVDDFGTGYSSLAYLRAFPLDRLKVDRLFVTSLTADNGGHSHSILRAILSLAAALGLETTAEGVESEAQAALLRDQGCDEIQGYYVSRPIEADAVSDFCLHWHPLAIPSANPGIPGPRKI